MKKCAFKDIKDNVDIDNLVYFNSLSIKDDPYSNSILMDYSVKKIENDIKLNNETSLLDNNELLEKKYEEMTQGQGGEEIFRNILESGKQLENDILELDSKKKEVNDIIKEMQNKISLIEMA